MTQLTNEIMASSWPLIKFGIGMFLIGMFTKWFIDRLGYHLKKMEGIDQ